jgi:hypothetical protein
MGERGKNDEMKHRRTNFEAAAPDHEKPEAENAEDRDPLARSTTAPAHKPEARLGREVQARIGQQLRAMYDDVVSEGVPQHINELLARLGDKD